jgi:hypothetical protein
MLLCAGSGGSSEHLDRHQGRHKQLDFSCVGGGKDGPDDLGSARFAD